MKNYNFNELIKKYKESFEYIKSEDKRKPNIDNYVEWNNCLMTIWEYEMLTDIGAINKQGIICDYPILSVTIKSKNGEKDITQDFDGNIHIIRTKAEELKASGQATNIKIVYCPRVYSQWVMYKKEQQENALASKYAEEINTPLVSAYREIPANIF